MRQANDQQKLNEDLITLLVRRDCTPSIQRMDPSIGCLYHLGTSQFYAEASTSLLVNHPFTIVDVNMPQVSFNQLITEVSVNTNLISFPTDTLPALAALPEHANLIFVAKQRTLEKPLILMAAELNDLWGYVVGSPLERQIWQQVANQHLPGALTLVLPASDRVPPTLNPSDPSSIGVRVPNHAIARAILFQTGPLATTSANRSGEPALQTMAEVEAQFPRVFTLNSDLVPGQMASAEKASGLASTVARWTGSSWDILRQGAIAL
jgi:L-threonylcarbamoyladenylate synthase